MGVDVVVVSPWCPRHPTTARITLWKFYLLCRIAPSSLERELFYLTLTQPKVSTMVFVLFRPMSTLKGPRQTL